MLVHILTQVLVHVHVHVLIHKLVLVHILVFVNILYTLVLVHSKYKYTITMIKAVGSRFGKVELELECRCGEGGY
jgi:hypothetical protein